ncbi:thiol-specific monooxygenase [Colletotrichum sojae]|uniref:Thiol-specific monooxygenase n=1 Tax=Colletotrichum sojae TaxID=2175907 RepID=A0A8H6MIL5_9PEZI|nr:thiol-specific monooxygenase [Colletotrichum sojae]
MSQPENNDPPNRVRLVAYSDSESDAETDDDVPEPEPATGPDTQPQPPPPETENELAQIVIRLQEKYIHEYENLETRQDDMARQLEDWKGAIEDRLRMELKILEALVKVSRRLLPP